MPDHCCGWTQMYCHCWTQMYCHCWSQTQSWYHILFLSIHYYMCTVRGLCIVHLHSLECRWLCIHVLQLYMHAQQCWWIMVAMKPSQGCYMQADLPRCLLYGTIMVAHGHLNFANIPTTNFAFITTIHYKHVIFFHYTDLFGMHFRSTQDCIHTGHLQVNKFHFGNWQCT